MPHLRLTSTSHFLAYLRPACGAFFPPSWKIRLSRSETVSITFWSNQERSSRLPLIWLDNLLWGLHKDTALITRICCTLPLYLGRPACLWCATRNRFVIKEFHGNLKLLSIIRSIWRLFKAVMEKKKGQCQCAALRWIWVNNTARLQLW